jgi:hypothetical protein
MDVGHGASTPSGRGVAAAAWSFQGILLDRALVPQHSSSRAALFWMRTGTQSTKWCSSHAAN